MAKAVKLMHSGVCNGSLTGNYSFNGYKECGRREKLYKVSLYGTSLGGEKCGYTMMCSDCVEATRKEWSSIEVS